MNSVLKKNKVYLDYNATTPLAKEVLQEITFTLDKAWGNPSSCYENGQIAKQIIERSRKQVAEMISALPSEIIFTSGGTESNNLVLYTAVKHFKQDVGEGFPIKELPNSHNMEFGHGEQAAVLPHILSSQLEHDSIKLTLQHFSQIGEAEVTFVPSSHTTGCIDVKNLFASIRVNTCLVTVMLANNESGIVQPVSEIGRKLVEVNKERTSKGLPFIHFHTDAAQAIGKISVDVEQLNVHYLTIAGHKFYGPRIGALFLRSAPILPMLYGGGQERGLRPGTENTGMVAGLGKACELVSTNLNQYHDHMKGMRNYLEDQLELSFPGKTHFNGRLPGVERLPNTCNVSIIGSQLKGNLVLSTAKSFEASVGAACHSNQSNGASPILLAIGIAEDIAINALRLSVGIPTTREDIDQVVSDLKQAVMILTTQSSPNA